MKKTYTIFAFLCISWNCLSQSKVDHFIGKAFTLKSQQDVPAMAEKIHIGENPSENCICQYIINTDQANTNISQDEIFNISSIKKIALFDGSQRTIYYMFVDQSKNYFKFECYSSQLKQEDLLAFFDVKK